MLPRWGPHVRRRPVLGVLEITLLWHAVLVAVAEGVPPLEELYRRRLSLEIARPLDDWMQVGSPGKAPDWWRLTSIVFLGAYGFCLTRRQPA